MKLDGLQTTNETSKILGLGITQFTLADGEPITLSIRSFILILIRNMHSNACLASDKYVEVEDRSDPAKFRLPCFISQIFPEILSSDIECSQEILTV
jgi:hypothetical protein